MNRIKLVKMCFENFKGYKSKEIEFGNITRLQGENESGKTSIAIAYNWLFFDKDYSLKSNPTVRPEQNGVVVNDVLVSVEVVCELNGREVSFKKVQEQTRTKDGVVNGSSNTFSINSVDKNKRDFEGYMENELGISMGEFLACTNPNQFMGQNQKDMRPILFKMATSNSDVDVACSMSELKPLVALLEKYTLEEIISMNKASVTKLDKEIKGIPVRIDEVSKTIVDIDVAEREIQRNELKRQISEKDKILFDNEKLCEEFQKSSDGILELNFQINGIVQVATDKLIAVRRELQKKSDEASQNFSQAEGKHKLAVMDIERLTAAIERNVAERKQLGVEHASIINGKFDDSKWIFDKDSTICPNCGQEYPPEKIQDIRAEFSSKREKAIDSFKNDNESKGQKIFSQATALKAQNSVDKEKITELEELIKQCKTDKIRFNKEKTEALQEIDKLPDKPDLSDNQEYERLCLELDLKKKTMEAMKGGSDYRGILKSEIDNLKKELAETEKIIAGADNSKAEQRILDLQAENKVLQQKKANCERIIDMCDTLSKSKNELLVEEINQHFSIVKWQLFDYQMNGKYKEVCIPTIDGYRFGDSTNEGREIITKLDICNSLQKFFKVCVPVFLDGAESLSKNSFDKIETDLQMVLLKVTEDKKLVVEVA